MPTVNKRGTLAMHAGRMRMLNEKPALTCHNVEAAEPLPPKNV